jgi:TonB family protein
MKKIGLIISLIIISSISIWGQQSDFQNGVELYQKGEYKAAEKVFEKVVKANPKDERALTFLALSYLKTEKLKEAETALGKSLALNANQTDTRKALAYVYMLRGKFDDAISQANVLVQANGQDAGVYYIIGWSNLRLGNYDEALENAQLAINLDPNIANAYLLKAFAVLNAKFDKEENKAKAARYGSVADNIGKFIALSKDLPNRTFWVGQEETLRRFSEYYAQREKDKTSADNENANVTPIKIITKPRPSYTDYARYSGISGNIRLLIGFGEDGKVRDVLVLNSLGYGLDEEAVRAARKIKFEPAKKDGKPIYVVKIVEYGFAIY